jgi:hypothetical protein
MIREEVDRNMRWSAGIFGGGLSNQTHGSGDAPTLGGPDDEDARFETTVPEEEDEEFSQTGARVYNRTGGSGSGHDVVPG